MTIVRADNKATVATEMKDGVHLRHLYRRGTSIHWITIREARNYFDGMRLEHKACVVDDFGVLVDLNNGPLSSVSLRDGAGLQ